MKTIEAKDKTVSLVGLGPSMADYFKRCGNNFIRPTDQLWVINMLGCEMTGVNLVIAMDDPRWQVHSMKKDSYIPSLVKMGVPIFTAQKEKYPELPGFLPYPHDPVMMSLPRHPTGKFTWIDNSCTAAIAYAIYQEVKELHLFGIDFLTRTAKYPSTWPTMAALDIEHEPSWRAYYQKELLLVIGEPGIQNICWLLGVASERGIEVVITPNSTLLESDLPEFLYGFVDDKRLQGTHDGKGNI